MKVCCPKCNREIPADAINVETDVAQCRNCNEVWAISDTLDGTATDGIGDPPRGVWHETAFNGFTLGASVRSAAVLFFLPFTLVWSGGSMIGLYGTQIATGEFDLFRSLFGIPFLLGSIFLWSMTLMYLFGKVVVTVERDQGCVFTGIGPIGRRRRFQWSEMERARELASGKGDSNSQSVSLEGTKDITFGSVLTPKRRRYVVGVLRRLLLERDRRTRRGAFSR